MPRSLQSGRDGVVAHTPCFKTHFETFRCERPPRRFAPPLLCKEGNVVPNNFVKKTRTYSLVTQRHKGGFVSVSCFSIHCRANTIGADKYDKVPNEWVGEP